MATAPIPGQAPDGRPLPGHNVEAFQKYTAEQAALYVARDRAEIFRAKAADDYKKSLAAIPSNKRTEDMCQEDATALFLEMQDRYLDWCVAQDAVDTDMMRVRDEINKAREAENAEKAKLAEVELKAKEAEAGLLQGKDIAEKLSLVVGGGVGSTVEGLNAGAGAPSPNAA